MPSAATATLISWFGRLGLVAKSFEIGFESLPSLLKTGFVNLLKLRLVGQGSVAQAAEIGAQRQPQRIGAGTGIQRRERRTVSWNDLQQFTPPQAPQVADP